MAVETELKLRIAPAGLARLKRHPLLKELATGRAVTRKLRNVYYDTPGLGLHRRKMALRLRHVGGKWLQTLKGGGGVEAGLHSRNEWETPVAGEALDLAALKACGGKLPRGAGKKLQPVFSTDFTRNARRLNFEGAVIELCMDSGEIRAGKKSRPISELELELISGEPRQLFKLALALLDIVPLEVEHASKAEYGYRLHAGGKPAPVRARSPQFQPDQDTASALRGAISDCLLHVQANVPGAIGRLDDEYLHQVRVGLRRLRVVMAMAGAYCEDAELDALRGHVSELCAELGGARDWDVFITQTLAPVCKQFPDHAGLRAILRASETARRKHHAQMRASLASGDFQRLLLRIGLWMQKSDRQAPSAGDGATLAEFAARILAKRGKQVHRRGLHPAQADAAQLHALRIACKKLRYSAEIFSSLSGTAKTVRSLGALSGLQDTLGLLNDIATARRLLGELGHEKNRAARAIIQGWLEHGHARRMAALKKDWKQFSRRVQGNER
jgi:inorganic triphosphatase YgiF